MEDYSEKTIIINNKILSLIFSNKNKIYLKQNEIFKNQNKSMLDSIQLYINNKKLNLLTDHFIYNIVKIIINIWFIRLPSDTLYYNFETQIIQLLNTHS